MTSEEVVIDHAHRLHERIQRGRSDEPEAFCQRLAQVIAHELGELSAMKPASRLAARHSRYRNLGLG